MPYVVDLNKSPLAVLALWDGQPVKVNGWPMVFYVHAVHKQIVYLSTGNDRGQAYLDVWEAYMNGKMGFAISPPHYSDYYKHVRQGHATAPMANAHFSREELAQVLAGGTFHIA